MVTWCFFEEDKKLFEKQLGIPIINEYGASELDLIAFQNPEGEWQVRNFVCWNLDDNGVVPPYGKKAEL
jgi:phenylacetate-CoA ligase